MKTCLIAEITLVFATIPVTFAVSVLLNTSLFSKTSEGLEPLSDGTFKSTKFWISTFRANAADAEFYCNLTGHRLLSIRTERKEREIKNILNMEEKKLMRGGGGGNSGQDIEDEGMWVSWVRGNMDQVLFSRFPSYEIVKANENCLSIYLYKQRDAHLWGKMECSFEGRFICERKDRS